MELESIICGKNLRVFMMSGIFARKFRLLMLNVRKIEDLNCWVMHFILRSMFFFDIDQVIHIANYM